MRWSAIWTRVVAVFDVLTFSTTPHDGTAGQMPLIERPAAAESLGEKPFQQPRGPIFKPPSGEPADAEFVCEYPKMTGYKFCSTASDRGCWLQAPGKPRIGIETDYENERLAPVGVTRKYFLNLTDAEISPDGTLMKAAKLFNGTYPGPWIQACWGDTLEITVLNSLSTNGTTIHWHGIRQLDTVAMDGVNGVTQCPIAPGSSFTYRFKALQYGSSWYHSHYALQYADGLVGPMTIHGPSSDNYDEAIRPTLMTDWLHESAFGAWWRSLNGGSRADTFGDNILVNGSGRALGDHKTPPKYQLLFQRGRRYLMRLINTSVDSTFTFSIDNHNLTLIGADFVPISNHSVDHIVIGIGQRYHVIVEANPIASRETNFWMRTIPLSDCGSFKTGNNDTFRPENKTGIIRYVKGDTRLPTTKASFMENPTCRDQDYNTLNPVHPWKVGEPVNYGNTSYFEVAIGPTSGSPFYHPENTTLRWNMYTASLWLNFADPTLAHAGNASYQYPPNAVVISQEQAGINQTDGWMYLLITGNGITRTTQFPVRAAHPIHLHGHDFAILAQSERSWQVGGLSLKTDNPPRRDVALLPASGYLVLAFKADNPGSWLMHCHIAWHASGGLALQVLEDRSRIKLSPEDEKQMQDTCAGWKKWNATAKVEQDDSGI